MTSASDPKTYLGLVQFRVHQCHEHVALAEVAEYLISQEVGAFGLNAVVHHRHHVFALQGGSGGVSLECARNSKP